MPKFTTREEWLTYVANELRPHYKAAGHPIPVKVRFGIGFMVEGYRSKAIGQCWDVNASGDKHVEIFIAPSQDKPVKVAGILAHELVHAAVGHKAGHKKPFKDACKVLGLEGKATCAFPGADMQRKVLDPILKRAGKLPHARINAGTIKRKKAGTRLLKAECAECGYCVRVTKKWLDVAGAPFCGIKSHGRMACDAEDEGEGEE